MSTPRVFSFWWLFVVLAVMTMVCAASMVGTYYLRRSERWKIEEERMTVEQRTRVLELEKLDLEVNKRREQIEKQKSDIEQQLAEDKKRLILARHKKQLQLDQVKAARLSLEHLVTAQAYLTAGLENLKTNYSARAIATSAIMVFHARRLYCDQAQNEIPNATFESHRNFLFRIEDEITTRLEMPYELEEQITKGLAQEEIWIHSRKIVLSAAQDRLKELQDFKIRLMPPDGIFTPPTLAEAMAEQGSLESTNAFVIYPKTKEESARMMPIFEQRQRESRYK